MFLIICENIPDKVRGEKETRYKLNDFEGINLITKNYEKEITNWMNYYAKPDKYLHTHLIESGVIAKYLCNTMFRNTIKRISELTESDTSF